MKNNLLKITALLSIMVVAASCGVNLNLPIKQGIVKDSLSIILNPEAGNRKSLPTEHFFNIADLGISANNVPLATSDPNLVSAYENGNLDNGDRIEYIYPITINKPGYSKPFYGKIAFFNSSNCNAAKNSGVSSYYQISIPEKFFADASRGLTSCTYEFWRQGLKSYVTWIIWLSDAPLSSTESSAPSRYKNMPFIKVGLSVPTGKYFSQQYQYPYYTGHNLTETRSTPAGFHIEWGKLWYINSLDIGKQLKFGIDESVHLSFNTINYKYSTDTAASFDKGIGDVIMLGLQFGPSVTYQIAPKTFIIGSLDLNLETIGADGPETYYTNNIADNLSGFVASPSLKFDYRYSHLLVGLEFNFRGVQSQTLPTGDIQGLGTIMMDIGFNW